MMIGKEAFLYKDAEKAESDRSEGSALSRFSTSKTPNEDSRG